MATNPSLDHLRGRVEGMMATIDAVADYPQTAINMLCEAIRDYFAAVDAINRPEGQGGTDA